MAVVVYFYRGKEASERSDGGVAIVWVLSAVLVPILLLLFNGGGGGATAVYNNNIDDNDNVHNFNHVEISLS